MVAGIDSGARPNAKRSETNWVHGARSRRSFAVGGAIAVLSLLLLSALPIAIVAAPARASITHDEHPALSPTNPIQHVFLIIDENQNWATILHNASYFASLNKTGAFAGNFWAYRPDSEPAYIAETSGIIPTGFSPGGYDVPNVGDLVTQAGGSWVSYFESMPANCTYAVNAGAPAYDRTHNPFVQYSDIYNNKALCDSHVLPLSSFNPVTPPANYTLIVANTSDDMDHGSVAQGNTWMQNFINATGTGLDKQSWWSSTAVMLTFDEAGMEHAEPVMNHTTGGHVYLAGLGPYSKVGENSSTFYTFFNVLTTTEWLLGLGGTGNTYDNWSAYPPMYSLFTLPHSTNSTTYTVSGNVQYQNLTGAVGVNVALSGEGITNSTITGSGGAFSFQEPNGNYTLTATEAGYQPGAVSVQVNGAAVTGLTITLDPLAPGFYSVTGGVYNATGPLNGASINVTETARVNGNWTNLTQTTGPPFGAGTFGVTLQNGTYSIRANSTGYANETRSITVSGANVAGVSFYLTTNGAQAYPVSGSVETPSGAPVEGAAVAFSGPSAGQEMSGANGVFTFYLANGSYKLTASAVGYVTASKSESVSGTAISGIVLMLTLPVGANFTVSGTVTSSATGRAIASASVSATASGLNITMTTNAQGAFTFQLPNGTYELVAIASGFSKGSDSVKVNDGPVTGLSIPLTPTSTTSKGSPSLLSQLTQPWVLLIILAAAILIGLGVYLATRRKKPGKATETQQTTTANPPSGTTSTTTPPPKT